MLSINFASRAELAQLGLTDADIEAFVELRTRIGEIPVETLATSAFSEHGRNILEIAFTESEDNNQARLGSLNLLIQPNPPIAAMDEMNITVIHHGFIDRELKTLTTSFLPHGTLQLTVYDISPEHIIKIELSSEDGVVATRIAIPPHESFHHDGSPWQLFPVLGANEEWRSETGPYPPDINAKLKFATHARPKIVPVTPEKLENIHRKGRFIVPGRPDFRFDVYSFSFSFPDTQLFTRLPALFGDGQAPHVARLEPNDPVVSRIFQLVTAEPGAVDFGGMFEINVPNSPGIEAPGWVWILMGSSIYVGFQPDPDLYASRDEIIITLPHGGKETGDGVPFNITERGLLDRPELFGVDAGLNCRPFDQPGRILGEHRFQTALRVTQPFVERARGDTITFEDITKRPIDFPREPVSRENFIEYEGEDPSIYQAKTVSIGHLLEMAVRYRSNGYSLGDIAYSLTLAPRQKRRIVKIEYSRTESGRRSEITRAEDEVADEVDSSRNYDNVVSASLDEWSHGRSRASTNSVAGGLGFVMPGFAIGGGAASSTSSTSSSQGGGRRTAASERQQINDSIRRRGEALRTLQSTVVQEVEQSESVEGVSEVVQNINHTRSFSVIYHEILRHLRVDTEIAGVTECVYVPMPVNEFSDRRIKRHKDVLRRYARTHWERLAFENIEFLPNSLNESDLPGDVRAKQHLRTLSGSIWIRLGLEMPGEGEIADEIADATDVTITDERIRNIYRRSFGFFTPYLPVSISQIVSRTSSASPTVRNRYFQGEIAPHMARHFVNDLQIWYNDTDLGADFTLASNYSYGRNVKVDFTVNLQELEVELSREDIERLTVKFSEKYFDSEADDPHPRQILPPRSFMDVTRGVIRYGNDFYDDNATSDSGTRDLINSVNGHADVGGALLTFRLSHADNRNLHALIKNAYRVFKERINAKPFFYHKAIWWNMDRDELYTILDGYSFEEAGGRSLASTVAQRPLGILGNTLIFKVTTDSPLDPMFANFDDLKAHYIAGLPPSDPIRVSLPTDGLYARAHMDGCVAAEEHNGSFDWVFDNQEPELADLPSSLLESRRSQAPDMTPTRFPETIINLQNAPGMPAPSGLEGAINAVQNADAFRDMAGLAGTQANAQAGLNTAAGLATGFGNMAFKGAMAQLQADANAASDLKGMFSAIEKARDSGLISAEQASELAMDVTKRRMQGKDDKEDQHRRDIEKKTFESEGGGSITKTDKDGSKTVVKNPTPPSKDNSEEEKPSTVTSPPVGHVRWLEGENGEQELLLYNFGVGEHTLHTAHKKALKKISVQIIGVDDINKVEGRASATQTRSDEEERLNEVLSKRRMEGVWNELMRYAFDPQSNPDIQLYLSDESPIRDLYGDVLADIPKGQGHEDPVERSVLIRLKHRIQPDIEPITVAIPEESGIPQCTIYGHTVQFGDQSIFQQKNNRIMVSQNNENTLVEGTHYNEGLIIENKGNGNVDVSADTTITIFNVNFNTYQSPGQPPQLERNSKKTQKWLITLTNPDVRGNTVGEVFELVKGALGVLKDVSQTLPSTSVDAANSLLISLGVTAEDINPPLMISTFFEKVFDVLTDDANSVGKSLRGLVQGTVQLDIEITAISMEDPTKTETRKGKLTGRGVYFRRIPDVSGNNVEPIVDKFEYETNPAFTLKDWNNDSDLFKISINFSRAAVSEDLISALGFLTDLSVLVTQSELPNSVLDTVFEKIRSAISLASQLTEGSERLSFKPEGQEETTRDAIYVGESLTLFKFEEYGIFKYDL